MLQLTQRFPPALGGVESHVYQLASGLARAGVEVEVSTTDLGRDVPFERLPADAAGPFPFPVRWHRALKFAEAPHGLGIAAPSMLLDALDHRADVLHAHAYGYFPTWVGSAAASLDGAALVITPHSDAGSPSAAKRVFNGLVPRLTLRRAARVISVTRHEAALLVSLGLEPDRIAIIPNGIDPSEFAAVPERRPVQDTVTGIFVGRIDPTQKGLDTLVRAVSLVPSSVRFHLRLVGEDWGGAKALRQLSSHLGIGDRIEFVGPVSRAELLREFARADLLVLPSRFEPFGIVLLEAMAAGLPIVASRVGGIPEVAPDGEVGLLVEPGDPADLAAALLRLAEGPALRSRLGAAGRQRARSYSWDVLIPRVLAVYREALEERA